MAKFDKIAVLNKIGSTGMVPVFYHKDAEVAKKVVKACLNAKTDISYYDRNREALYNGLKELGFECVRPEGAFYLFPCIKEFGMSSDEFANRFLHEEEVAVIPGTAFGDCGEGFLRISYAYSIEELKEALGRLANFVERLRKEKNL